MTAVYIVAIICAMFTICIVADAVWKCRCKSDCPFCTCNEEKK